MHPMVLAFSQLKSAGCKVTFLTYANTKRQRDIEGSLNAEGKRFAVVVSRFNSFITERLLDGALLALRQAGAKTDDITIVRVPGAFEIPSASRQLATSGKYDAIVCIGCLLRGDTLHYDVIANEVTRGIGQSAQETGVPHAFGVLTCDTLEQAIDRAGLKAGNKGYEAGLAAVEMASLHDKIAEQLRVTGGEAMSKSGTRRKSRELALQMLFQLDMGKQTTDEVRKTFWSERRDLDEKVRGFADDLFRVASEREAEIDQLIEKNAEHWRMDRMAAVDRNVLRAGIAEFLGFPETPRPVVINEALEIARRFSTPGVGAIHQRGARQRGARIGRAEDGIDRAADDREQTHRE